MPPWTNIYSYFAFFVIDVLYLIFIFLNSIFSVPFQKNFHRNKNEVANLQIILNRPINVAQEKRFSTLFREWSRRTAFFFICILWLFLVVISKCFSSTFCQIEVLFSKFSQCKCYYIFTTVFPNIDTNLYRYISQLSVYITVLFCLAVVKYCFLKHCNRLFSKAFSQCWTSKPLKTVLGEETVNLISLSLTSFPSADFVFRFFSTCLIDILVTLDESLSKWTLKKLEFTAAARGFHIYRNFWKPCMNGMLSCSYERNNALIFSQSNVEKVVSLLAILPGRFQSQWNIF